MIRLNTSPELFTNAMQVDTKLCRLERVVTGFCEHCLGYHLEANPVPVCLRRCIAETAVNTPVERAQVERRFCDPSQALTGQHLVRVLQRFVRRVRVHLRLQRRVPVGENHPLRAPPANAEYSPASERAV